MPKRIRHEFLIKYLGETGQAAATVPHNAKFLNVIGLGPAACAVFYIGEATEVE